MLYIVYNIIYFILYHNTIDKYGIAYIIADNHT